MQWHRDILRLEDYADKMQKLMFCFGSDDGGGGGDEPDGVTFSSGDDYQAGGGVTLSSDNVSQGDTYRGENTSLDAFGGSGGNVADIIAGNVNAMGESLASAGDDGMDALAAIAAAGGNTYSTPAAARAQAMAAPRTRSVLSATSSDGNTVTRGLPPQLSLAGELINRNARMGTPVYAGGYGDPVGTVRNAQFPARGLSEAQAMNSAGGQVYYDELTGTYKEGADPTLMERAAESVMGYDEAPVNEMNARAGISDLAQDQAEFDRIMASAEGVNRDSEVVSALSDNFLDQTGRDDMDNLAGEAIEYFNSPVTKGIQALEGFSPVAGLLKALSGNPSLTRTKAGLPTGRIGDMQIAIQQGGRGVYNDDGSMAYVQMDDGTRVGEFSSSSFGSSDPDIVQPMTNPVTGQQRCPQGYTFDATVNACVPDSAPMSGSPVTSFPANPDMYVRMTALDNAPANVPTGFDFGAANRAFQESYAYRPQYYSRTPMDLTGFTKLK